jgi:hypothetical protein
MHILYSPSVDTIGEKRKITLTLIMVLDLRGEGTKKESRQLARKE